MQRKFILFDLDGTLTDPVEGITNGIMYALKKFGIVPPPRKELYKFIGPPLEDSFTEFYGFSAVDALKATKYYIEYYHEKGLYENVLYPGTTRLLQNLTDAGKTLALSSSKARWCSQKILEHFGLARYFSTVQGANIDGSQSNKSIIISNALQALGVTDRASAVMVGDRMHDVIGAIENGIDCIGVTYGYGSADELRNAGAISLADNFTVLENLLL